MVVEGILSVLNPTTLLIILVGVVVGIIFGSIPGQIGRASCRERV